MSKKFFDIVDRRAKGFRDFEGLFGSSFDEPEEIELEKVVFSSKGEELFDNIFSVDPVTGLPAGDLALFMNKNTSPEVRQYITDNLMRDVSSASAPAVSAKDFKDLDDDMIESLSRKSNESLSSYRDRMIDFVRSQQESVKQQSLQSSASSDGEN